MSKKLVLKGRRPSKVEAARRANKAAGKAPRPVAPKEIVSLEFLAKTLAEVKQELAELRGSMAALSEAYTRLSAPPAERPYVPEVTRRMTDRGLSVGDEGWYPFPGDGDYDPAKVHPVRVQAIANDGVTIEFLSHEGAEAVVPSGELYPFGDVGKAGAEKRLREIKREQDAVEIERRRLETMIKDPKTTASTLEKESYRNLVRIGGMLGVSVRQLGGKSQLERAKVLIEHRDIQMSFNRATASVSRPKASTPEKRPTPPSVSVKPVPTGVRPTIPSTGDTVIVPPGTKNAWKVTHVSTAIGSVGLEGPGGEQSAVPLASMTFDSFTDSGALWTVPSLGGRVAS